MIKFRNNKIGVEKLKKQSKKADAFYVDLDSEEFQGVVRYVGEASSKDLQVGAKVYFNTNFQQASIKGTTICVMEDSNVFAIVDEESQEPQS